MTNCPTCGRRVRAIFDHVDQECQHWSDGNYAQENEKDPDGSFIDPTQLYLLEMINDDDNGEWEEPIASHSVLKLKKKFEELLLKHAQQLDKPFAIQSNTETYKAIVWDKAWNESTNGTLMWYCDLATEFGVMVQIQNVEFIR